MQSRRGRYVMVRAVVVAVLAAVIGGGVVFTGSGVRQTGAQEEPLPAAVVAGDCGNLGDVAADMRPLTASEGGVRTSFSTIDLTIGELTGGGYAVVVGEADAPAACGDLTGAGEDVYVALEGRNDSGLGGIAWLHARGERTQVTLFVGAGLGPGGGPTPTEDPNGPPEPPVNETPTPAAGEGFYVSPTFGYTLTYDPADWQERVNRTEPGQSGPSDYLALGNSRGSALAELVSFGMPDPILAPQYLDYLTLSFERNERISNLTIRTDANGNELRGGDESHAFLVINFTWTNDLGAQSAVTFHMEAWQMPTVEGFLALIYQTNQNNYEADAPAREALVQGLVLPQ